MTDPTTTAEMRVPSGLHGRCAESTAGLLGQPLACSLLAGHDGMHHDDATGADWRERVAGGHVADVLRDVWDSFRGDREGFIDCLLDPDKSGLRVEVVDD